MPALGAPVVLVVSGGVVGLEPTVATVDPATFVVAEDTPRGLN